MFAVLSAYGGRRLKTSKKLRSKNLIDNKKEGERETAGN